MDSHHRKPYYFLFFLALSFCSASHAATQSGIEFVDSLSTDNSTLTLNGTGTRYFWFIPIYAAALYLTDSSQDADYVINHPHDKRIILHFLYRKVSKDKLLKTLDQGFSDNLSNEELTAIEQEIEQLKGMFKTVYKGDRIVLDYSPNTGTRLFLNDELQGAIMGEHFHRAVFRVWLGDKPADVQLKKGLLTLP